MLLIQAALCGNMGRHIMKTTIEIADDLFERGESKSGRTFREANPLTVLISTLTA
jgi:hypothetical protein